MPFNNTNNDNDDTFRMFGREVLNVPPLIGLAWTATVILIVVDVTLLFLQPEMSSVLIPVLISAVTLWAPSPASAVRTPVVNVPLTLTQHPSYQGTTRLDGDVRPSEGAI